METLLFHPAVVHVPIALGLLMPLLAAGLALAWWRKWLSPRAWWIAVGLQALLVVAGVVALRSGEADEDRVEQVVPERLIEAHEEAATVFVWGAGGVLVAMIAAAALAHRRAALPVAALATLGTLGVLGLGYRTGKAGGDLVYVHGAASAYAGSAPPSGATRATPARPSDDD